MIGSRLRGRRNRRGKGGIQIYLRAGFLGECFAGQEDGGKAKRRGEYCILGFGWFTRWDGREVLGSGDEIWL